MPNNFKEQDNISLIHIAQTLVQVATNAPAYGLSAAALDTIGNDAGNLIDLALQYTQQEAVLRGLTDQKAAARAALILKLGQTAKGLEANPLVSDAMLRTAALSARPTKGSKPTSLAAPTGLAAQGFSDGSLALSWIPQNRTRVGHVVEVSADGLTWSYLATTQRRTLKATGFTPGVPVWARVTAVNSTLSSAPSNVASVYAPTTPLTVVRGGAEDAKSA